MKFSKNCPSCNKPIYYIRAETLKDSLLKNRLCRNCYLQRMSDIPKLVFKRNCPVCGKVKEYKDRYDLNEAIRHNRKCKSCSKKGPLHHRYGKKLSNEIKTKSSKNWFKKGQRPVTADQRKNKKYEEFYGIEKTHKIKEKLASRPRTLAENIKRSNSCKKAKCGFSNKGRKCTDENRKKFRLQMINRLKETGQNFHPGYSKKACDYFNNLMLSSGTDIQHALNRGEYFIKDLGYWIDGYDIKNNIVYEFDERRHFDVYGNLSLKDQIKQKEITELLNCTFKRIKWNEIP